jgi:hypothetical protein
VQRIKGENEMKASELTGAALDWAVAEIENPKPELYRDYDGLEWERGYSPSTDWAQGGPIIERERIELEHDGFIWWARIKADEDHSGPTPLIAAMRCYVASKLGDEVEIPEELT